MLTNGYLDQTGKVWTGGSYDNLGYTETGISVSPGDVIYGYYVTTSSSIPSVRAIIAYKGETYINGGENATFPYTIPNEVDNIKISVNQTAKNAGVKLKIVHISEHKVVIIPSNVIVEEGKKQVTAENLQIINNIETNNLLDVSASIKKKLISADGTITDNNSYDLSDYMPVVAGKEYIFTHLQNGARMYGTIRKYACFDSDKQVVANAGSDDQVTRPFTIQSGVSYIRISYYNGYTDYMFRVGNQRYYSYEPYTYQKIQENYIPHMDDLKKQMERLHSGIFERIGNIRTTLFNSVELADGWTNSGFTLSASGATPTAEGDLLEFDQFSDLDSSSFSVVVNAVSAFRLFLVRYQKQYSATGGMIVEFNMVNKKISLYKPTVVGTTPSEVVTEFDIPFDFVAGQYTLTVGNCAELERFTIFGAGEIAEFYVDGRTISDWTRPHDKYGIRHKSGSYTVKQISFGSSLPSKPDVLVVGDSICEGDTIRLIEGGGFEKRWVGLLSNITLLALWGQGGNNSTHINGDLTTLTTLFRPRKVIYAVGVNDSTYATWLTNCQAFTSAFEAIDAEVIYATPVLRPDYEANSLEQQRAWIKASGHRYIDFCAAMSVNGECEEIDTSLFLSDQLHPNVEGHKHMYEAVIGSLPDLIMY